MRFYCPECWSDFPEDISECPTCGLDIPAFWKGKDYVEKLIAALDHPEPETEERAARILGNLGEVRAVQSLIALVGRTEDVYVARAAVEALSRIGTSQARDFLAQVARSHKARMVREAAGGMPMNMMKQSKDKKSPLIPMMNLTSKDGAAQPFSDLVLDYNGTLALDGFLLPGVAGRLRQLSKVIRVHVLTADTFEKAEHQLKRLPVSLKVIRTGADKAEFVRRLGPEKVIAVGNGRNDALMMEAAGLGVAVIGPEGAAGKVLRTADVAVTDIRHALDMIIHPLRLKATLRD